MTKRELVQYIAKSADLSQASAERALNSLIVAVAGALKRGEEVALPNFGTFSVATRAARAGRDPRTGAEIAISAAKLLKFRAGKALKDAVD